MQSNRIPEWLLADFTVKRVETGFLVMDGDTPVSNAVCERRATANAIVRELTQRREANRARYELAS